MKTHTCKHAWGTRRSKTRNRKNKPTAIPPFAIRCCLRYPSRDFGGKDFRGKDFRADRDGQMALSSDQLRKVLGHFATGVTVVTTRRASGEPWGFTVNAFSSVSLSPPLILVCVGHSGESFQAMSEAEYFAVNFLTEDQEEVSRVFASRSPDRFDGVRHKDTANGAPLLEGCLGFLECRKTAAHEHGDHTILIGEVLTGEAHGGAPLLFYQSSYGRMETAKTVTSK